MHPLTSFANTSNYLNPRTFVLVPPSLVTLLYGFRGFLNQFLFTTFWFELFESTTSFFSVASLVILSDFRLEAKPSG